MIDRFNPSLRVIRLIRLPNDPILVGCDLDMAIADMRKVIAKLNRTSKEGADEYIKITREQLLFSGLKKGLGYRDTRRSNGLLLVCIGQSGFIPDAIHLLETRMGFAFVDLPELITVVRGSEDSLIGFEARSVYVVSSRYRRMQKLRKFRYKVNDSDLEYRAVGFALRNHYYCISTDHYCETESEWYTFSLIGVSDGENSSCDFGPQTHFLVQDTPGSILHLGIR